MSVTEAQAGGKLLQREEARGQSLERPALESARQSQLRAARASEGSGADVALNSLSRTGAMSSTRARLLRWPGGGKEAAGGDKARSAAADGPRSSRRSGSRDELKAATPRSDANARRVTVVRNL